ncbi:MAG: hypothetical protein ACQCN6_01795 [Candidatus Bathyarchaeia archaeon]
MSIKHPPQTLRTDRVVFDGENAKFTLQYIPVSITAEGYGAGVLSSEPQRLSLQLNSAKRLASETPNPYLRFGKCGHGNRGVHPCNRQITGRTV